MRTAVRARRILPLAGETAALGLAALAAPLRAVDDGVILEENGRVLAVEPYPEFRRRVWPEGAPGLEDLGEVTLVPGLVNCHTHLEFSHLGGRTVLGQGFLPWLRSLIPLIGSADEALVPALNRAVSTLRRTGTAHVGDVITRRPDLVAPAVFRQNLGATLFLECLGHDPGSADRFMDLAGLPLFADAAGRGGRPGTGAETAPLVAFSLAGHSLYSTSAENLARARAWCAARGATFSLHLAEHADEVECLRTGSGPFADLLRGHLVPEGWQAPGRHPVAEAQRLGLLGPGTLAVHCVQAGPEEVALLAENGCAVCLCPRSNAAINVGEAPARAYAAAGALLALGTDSLVSNSDLDLWAEIRLLAGKNMLPANALLRMATVNGACAMGLSERLGRLDRGGRFCYSSVPDDLAGLLE